MKDFEVKKSSISGKGLFAARLFKKGETVTHWHPEILTSKQFDALSEHEKHYVERQGNKYLHMREPERFINHSCEPNTEVRGQSDVAIRDIQAGEEITSDYIDSDVVDFVCSCGSLRCRFIDSK